MTLTFDLWPWKSIGFQTLLRTTYVPSLVKIHWRILILECSQGCYAVKIWPGDLDLWPWKSIGFQILLRSKYIPSLVKIRWRILILECSQGCYAVKIWPGDLDLWPWKSIGFQILLWTKYVQYTQGHIVVDHLQRQTACHVWLGVYRRLLIAYLLCEYLKVAKLGVVNLYLKVIKLWLTCTCSCIYLITHYNFNSIILDK